VSAGSRRASEMDAESGIETGDSDSTSASVTSSDYAPVAAAAGLPMTSPRRDNAVVTSDDLGEFIRLMMVQPPPSLVCHNDSDVAIVPPPTDFTVVDLPAPPAPADYTGGYSVLPPLLEVPEDESMSRYDLDQTDRPPPPPLPSPRIIEQPRPRMRIPRNAANAPTQNVVEVRRDKIVSNRAQVSADGVAVVKSLYQPVPAKRNINTLVAANSVDDAHAGVDVAASRMLAENTTTTTMTTPSVSPTDSKPTRSMFSIPHLARRRFIPTSADSGADLRQKKTLNIWKRFMKRDQESAGGMTSSTGFTWTLLPHHRKSMSLQSQSLAESTATFRRCSPDVSPTQTKLATLAAVRARELHISAPFDFRDLSTTTTTTTTTMSNVEQRLEHQLTTVSDVGEQPTQTERRDTKTPGQRSLPGHISLPFDFRSLKPVVGHRAKQQRASSSDSGGVEQHVTSTTHGREVNNRHSAGHNISLPFDFRSLTSVVGQRREHSAATDGVKQPTSTDFNEDAVRLAAKQRINASELNASSASDEDVMTSERSARTTTHNYRDERGRLLNTAIDPRLDQRLDSRLDPRLDPRFNPLIDTKSSSLACISDDKQKQQTLPKNSHRHATSSAAAGALNHSNHSLTAGRRISALMHISATLPRIYWGRAQTFNGEDQSSSQLSSDQASAQGIEAELCEDEDLSEVTRNEYLQNGSSSSARPSPAADISQRLRRSLSEQPTPGAAAPASPLSDLLDLTLTLDSDYDEPRSPATSSECFDTFRGALKPVRWSDDPPSNAGKLRAQSFAEFTALRRQLPAYLDVQPPVSSFNGLSTARPLSAPVAAPRSAYSLTRTNRERSAERPLKVKLQEKLLKRN